MVFESLALYCIVHVYVVNCRTLRLMGTLGQDEVVLGTYADKVKDDCCDSKSAHVILAHIDVVMCNCEALEIYTCLSMLETQIIFFYRVP